MYTHTKPCMQTLTWSRLILLTQMSGFLVAFAGIKSILVNVAAISQKPGRNSSQLTLNMHSSRRPEHAYAAVPSQLVREGRDNVMMC